jgi:hypothetical protein
VREAAERKEGAAVGVGDDGRRHLLYRGCRHSGMSLPPWPTAAARPNAVAHDG